MPPQTEEASETRDIPCDDERDVYDHVNDGGGISAAFFFGLENTSLSSFLRPLKNIIKQPNDVFFEAAEKKELTFSPFFFGLEINIIKLLNDVF